MIEKDDWRLLNDVKHLEGMGVNPIHGKEIKQNKGDKQECVFCWEKVLGNPFELWYITDNLETCICEECFYDFKDSFRFQLLDGWDIEWDK